VIREATAAEYAALGEQPPKPGDVAMVVTVPVHYEGWFYELSFQYTPRNEQFAARVTFVSGRCKGPGEKELRDLVPPVCIGTDAVRTVLAEKALAAGRVSKSRTDAMVL
jgi:hypothetical protein